MNKFVICNECFCVGCRFCYALCPTNSISLSYETGHWKPQISDTCIQCGLCPKECPANHNLNLRVLDYNANLPCYAAWSRDTTLDSDGLARILGEQMIESGGCVARVWYNPITHCVEHRLCRTVEELRYTSDSKYALSNKDRLYNELNNIKKDTKILFFGVPCEIYAFKVICERKGLDDAYYVDLLCRGAGSPQFFEEHLKNIGVKDEDVRFRGGKLDDKFSVKKGNAYPMLISSMKIVILWHICVIVFCRINALIAIVLEGNG